MVWKIYNYLHVTSRIKYLRNFPLQVVCSVEQRYIIQLKSEFQEPKQVKCRFNFETPSKTLQRIQIVKKFGYITIICTNNFWRYVSYLFLSISLFSITYFLQKNFRQNQGKNSTRVSCVRTHANARHQQQQHPKTDQMKAKRKSIPFKLQKPPKIINCNR